ncbi:MAG: hypothetical protein M1819_007185 [Sarea resinae]|nr:MAG: hypothetical protein M1819_007185 [Sarea resinae]
MSTSEEGPWSEAEKVSLLVEILKHAPETSEVLASFIKDAEIRPRWTGLSLPEGRSLKSCQDVFSNLLEAPSATNIGKLGALSPRKRPLPTEGGSTPQGRTLQPRPAAFSSINGRDDPTLQTSPADEPPKRKRGRPSKADVQARAEAAAARGEVPPGSSHAGAPFTPSARPIAMMTPTGTSAANTPGTGSTGKRKRGRPSKADLAARRLLLEQSISTAPTEAAKVAEAATAIGSEMAGQEEQAEGEAPKASGEVEDKETEESEATD